MNNSSQLFTAAREGEPDEVKALLRDNPDLVSAKDAFGMTLLHHAAYQGNRARAELLLADKADVNAKDNIGQTPLHMAAEKGYTTVVEALLAHQADVNAKNYTDQTPSDLAAKKGYKDVAELLLAKDHGQTPFSLAAEKTYVHIRHKIREGGFRWGKWTSVTVRRNSIRFPLRCVNCLGRGPLKWFGLMLGRGKAIKVSVPMCGPCVERELRFSKAYRLLNLVLLSVGALATLNALLSSFAGTWPRLLDQLSMAIFFLSVLIYLSGCLVFGFLWRVSRKGKIISYDPHMVTLAFRYLEYAQEVARMNKEANKTALPLTGTDHLSPITRKDMKETKSFISWTTYDYLDGSDRAVIERAIAGNIDTYALSRVLSKVYARSYLLALGESLRKRECPASDCDEYRGYVVAGEGGARLDVSGQRVTCSRCRRSCHHGHFDTEGRNKLAVAIGEALAKKGGIELMRAVASGFTPQRKAYLLSHSWDGVGGWSP